MRSAELEEAFRVKGWARNAMTDGPLANPANATNGGTPLVQNRQATRLPCNFPVTCTHGGTRLAASVVDMGLSGLRVRLDPEVAAALEVNLETRHLLGLQYGGPSNCFEFNTVQARVAWVNRRVDGAIEAGAAYTHPVAYLERSWVRHLLRLFDLDSISVRDRRRHVRMPCGLQAWIGLAGEARGASDVAAVQIVNLSAGGVLLDVTSEFPVGAAVVVRFQRAQGDQIISDGTIRRCKPVARTGGYRVAVTFVDLGIDLMTSLVEIP